MTYADLKLSAGRVTTLAFLTLLLLTLRVRAQTPSESPTATPKSPEVLRLEDEKAQAELRRAIAEANKAELEARFPKPTTTPLTGTTTVEGAVIESQIVSYAQMAIAADKMVNQLKSTKPTIKSLVIYNDKDVNLLLSYKVALNQLAVINKGYDNLIEREPPSCPGVAPDSAAGKAEALRMRGTAALTGPVPFLTLAQSIFGSFVDLTALLRTNVEIKGQVFDVDETALVSQVFRAAGGKDGLQATLFYPALFPPNLDLDADKTVSPILSQLDALNNTKAYAEGLANGLEETTKAIKKAEATIEGLKAIVEGLAGRKKETEAKLAELESIYGRSDVPRSRRRIPPEKLELMLELKRAIVNFQKQLDEIQHEPDGKLPQAMAKKSRLDAELKCLLSKLKADLQNPEKLDETIAKLRAKNEQFAKFIEALVKADSATGLNSLTSYIKAENMRTALKGVEGKDTDFYWLQLKVLKAGGNNRIKTNLVVDIFTGGNRLSHSGGVVVEYILFDRNGKSVASDIFTEYSGYVKADKIRKLGDR